MIGDEVPVVQIDQYTKKAFEFKHPRQVVIHGYACPVCSSVIDLCHDAGLLAQACLLWEGTAYDPEATQPPVGFEIIEP
jgi:hypothetical protein